MVDPAARDLEWSGRAFTADDELASATFTVSGSEVLENVVTLFASYVLQPGG